MSALHSHTDPELLSLLRDDSQAALEELYERYWETLFALGIKRMGQEYDAEEVVQNIFISLWNRRHKLQLQYSLSTYLSVSVKYQVLTRLAQKKRQQNRLTLVSDES